jgi:ketopantoate reductase
VISKDIARTSIETNASVLIVGVGALGAVTGYHVALASQSVIVLVRPARLDAIRCPQCSIAMTTPRSDICRL